MLTYMFIPRVWNEAAQWYVDEYHNRENSFFNSSSKVTLDVLDANKVSHETVKQFLEYGLKFIEMRHDGIHHYERGTYVTDHRMQAADTDARELFYAAYLVVNGLVDMPRERAERYAQMVLDQYLKSSERLILYPEGGSERAMFLERLLAPHPNVWAV